MDRIVENKQERGEHMYTVDLRECIEKMNLECVTPDVNVEEIKITQSDVNRPALQLVGYFEHFAATRLQIIGFVEYTYLESLTDERKREVYENLLSYDI